MIDYAAFKTQAERTRLHLAEFDFRYSNRVKLGVGDTERTERALTGIKGKRLKYQATGEPRASRASKVARL